VGGELLEVKLAFQAELDGQQALAAPAGRFALELLIDLGRLAVRVEGTSEPCHGPPWQNLGKILPQ
jgi:hypothetical protein